jgi:hypothetical protein
MSAKWVAGTVKARLLLERRIGVHGTLELARTASLPDALLQLAGTSYADVADARDLEEAQRAVAASTLLRLRILAAWLPLGEAAGLRSLAAWFELCNIEDRLAYLDGGPLRPPFQLGTLATVWTAAAKAQSPEELSFVLGRSSWGKPGPADPRRMSLALRIAWAARVRAEVPEAREWAAGATAILLAEELLVARHAVEPALARRAGLGTGWESASSVRELRGVTSSGAQGRPGGLPSQRMRRGWSALGGSAARL